MLPTMIPNDYIWFLDMENITSLFDICNIKVFTIPITFITFTDIDSDKTRCSSYLCTTLFNPCVSKTML